MHLHTFSSTELVSTPSAASNPLSLRTERFCTSAAAAASAAAVAAALRSYRAISAATWLGLGLGLG
jgi:hypothetical protein